MDTESVLPMQITTIEQKHFTNVIIPNGVHNFHRNVCSYKNAFTSNSTAGNVSFISTFSFFTFETLAFLIIRIFFLICHLCETLSRIVYIYIQNGCFEAITAIRPLAVSQFRNNLLTSISIINRFAFFGSVMIFH